MASKETFSSASALLFPLQYRRKVLAWLFMNPESWIHLRELARVTGTAAGTLKKEMDVLLRAGLVNVRHVGNQTQFSANTAHPVYPELRALIEKTVGMGDLLRHALQPLDEEIQVAFFFGSMAESRDVGRSDVDVMIIGSVGYGSVVQALHPLQASTGREINPKVISQQDWLEKLAQGNSFLSDVMSKSKIFLIGTEHDLQPLG